MKYDENRRKSKTKEIEDGEKKDVCKGLEFFILLQNMIEIFLKLHQKDQWEIGEGRPPTKTCYRAPNPLSPALLIAT